MKKIKNNWFYIKNFRMNSLFWRTFIIVSLLLIMPFVSLSIVFYSKTFKTMRNEIAAENSSMLNSAVNIIDDTLIECDTMSNYIASNESAQLFMLNGNNSDSFSALARLAKTLPIIYKYIDSIYIYSESLGSVISNEISTPADSFVDMNWLDGYKVINSPKGVIVPRKKNGVYPSLITVIKPIYVADEKMGAVIMNINSQTLYHSMLSSKYYNQGQDFYLVDSQNRIILSKDVSNFGKQLTDIGFTDSFSASDKHSDTHIINGENYALLCANSGIKHYTYISASSMRIYEQRLSKTRLQLLLISLSLLLFGFALAYFASAKSYAPISEIISFLDTSNPYENMQMKNQNELMYIINSIKLHIDDKTKMEKILEERMKMLTKAQYDMLQTQINPHFLYNTLETINWMAYDMAGSENPVSTALVNLAGFFRNTLSSSSYLISIEDEISYTRDYINILNLRYGDLFDVKWDIDTSILSFNVIKICLQPIIENAVYHGFKPKGGNGLLTVSVQRSDDNIVFTVSDDGIGMEPDTVSALNAGFNENIYDNDSPHIGLANVNKRIKIIFGEDYGLFVKSNEGTGTQVVITIPIVK